jgi:ribosome-associated translation inhibitor RaiA
VDAGEFYEAIDLVADKLQRQLKKHKEKQRNRKHPAKSGPKMSEEETTDRAG